MSIPPNLPRQGIKASNSLLCNPNKSASNILDENEAIFHRFKLGECSSSSSWPKVADGQKLRVLKGCTSESFAQKVQARSAGKRTPMFLNVAEMLPPGKPKIVLQNYGRTHSFSTMGGSLKGNVSENSKELVNDHQMKLETSPSEITLRRNRPHKKHQKRIPSKDSHVCVIDRSETDELNSEKQLLPFPLTPTKDDFPDLTSALRVPSKCVGRYKFDEPAEKGDKSSQSHTNERKLRKKQPRRSDPISINIIDILRESDSCIEISPKNLRKLKNKEHEKKSLGGNFLDSSNPVRKRGKFRETGPRKKLSKTKQIILSERLKKQEQRGDPVGTFSLLPEKSLEPAINSVCDRIVSLKIIDNSSHLLKDGVNYSEETDVKMTDNFFSGTRSETDKLVHPAILNPILQSAIPENLQQNNTLPTLHSRKFRDYCNNIRSKDLDEAVKILLKAIHGFQDRHYQKDPIRAHAKRRFVLGFREVKKFLMLKKLKFIVVAPDLEPVKSPGGLDETVIQIREEGSSQKIPVIFAVGRRQLGFTLMRKVPISVVGIISSEGAEDFYQEVLTQWHMAVNEYQQKISAL